MVAWCGSGDLPGRVHVPFWSKKPRGGVIIEPLHTYSAQLITELNLRVEVQSPVTEPDAAAGNGGKGKHDGGDKGKHGGGKGSDDDGGKSKCTGPQKGRGGWLPKMAEMMVRVYNDDHDGVRLLADVHYQSSPIIKQLVDKELYG